jgi:DNA-binding response OmpR family regulator
LNILVVEDEADIRNLIKISLEDEGYNVLPARDGLELHEKDKKIYSIYLLITMNCC